jgi:long-chain acyl-CoA synthetase
VEAGVRSGERRRSIAEIRARAARAAQGFRTFGVREGDTVALLLRNDLSFFEASLGATAVGAFPVPINWHSTPEEVAYILRDCGAKAIVVHDDLVANVDRPDVRGDRPILVARTPPEIREAYRLPIAPEPGARDWDRWVESFPPIEDPSTATRMAVIYTSGTTGRPKGVRRLASAPGAPPRTTSLVGFGLDTNDEIRVLMNGPMYHSAPNHYAATALTVGADLVLQPRFDAEEMLALIERHRITHMHIVPTMFVRLLKLPESVRARYDVSSLRFVVHGAAPCPPDVKAQMIAWWGPVIHEYYGSTETSLATIHDSAEANRKPGTVGRPLPGVQIKIVDDAGVELGPGHVGEIYVRPGDAPDFTYIGLEEKRREIALGDFVTVGDIGYLDDDGYLFLCDRKRDMIISGGVNIYPAEIEAVLVGARGVRDCAVFGIPDDEFGEVVCAYVEPLDGIALDATELRAELAKHLSRFKLPKIFEIVSALPREDSGKIFKRRLRDPYWEGRGRTI